MATTRSFLTDEDMQRFEGAGELRRFQPGQTILHQLENCEYLYFIRLGVVQIDFSRLYGHDVLAHLGEGDFFGEISLLLKTPASANASAVKDVEVLAIGSDALVELLEADPGLAARFYKSIAHTLARRVVSANRR